ncbi:DUF4150 domain-containing protein [Rhodanobacter sp. A1T4]|jgi:hypothetical protein|uniref:DUF4150 domain-containing protein n=1 Tax=Rhodanobacter sp. A1T4 TaxID=2723087 RepID=UPI0016090356|nr:DUF4150 domain-containing protein [Rhodanobacter sp. A1T4]MBB6246673.1 hypothetical protein [Rhodanobacter sp. A1T4]
MFVNINLGVLSFAFPDVCFVPVLGVPVPTPFPNIALSFADIPVQFEIIIGGGLAENLLTIGAISNGDQVGAEGGVVSHLFMGPFRSLLGSFKVFMGCIPCTHMLGIVGQNGLLPNIVGITLTPAQICVLVFG